MGAVGGKWRKIFFPLLLALSLRLACNCFSAKLYIFNWELHKDTDKFIQLIVGKRVRGRPLKEKIRQEEKKQAMRTRGPSEGI